MKKIGFIGAYDKTDLILYVARILVEMEKTVLVVDATGQQKAKYIVPTINPSKTYFTEFEKIDVAVGFESEEEMYDYLGVDQNMELNYDYVFIDVDSTEGLENFYLDEAEINYFVTSFDLYSLKRGLEILSGLKETMELVRVLYSKRMKKEENEYLDFLSKDYLVEWTKDKIYFPFELGDQSIIIENQRASKIKMKRLSGLYRDNLLVMASQITKEDDFTAFKKAIKRIDKGGSSWLS